MGQKTLSGFEAEKKGIRVGGEMEARCGKCKEETLHVIVAMQGSRPVRVQCKRCQSVHQHRPAKVSKEPRQKRPARPAAGARSTRSRVTAAASRKDASLADRLAALPDARSMPYSPKQRFLVDQVMRHPTFGTGLVTEVKESNKIVVLFEGGERVLVHDRQPAQ